MHDGGQSPTLRRSLHYPDFRLQMTKPARIAAWALAAAIIVLSLVPPNLRPVTPLPHDVEHFGIFCAAGLAFALGYRHRNLLLLALLVSFAAAVEVAQLFVPGRHARVSDFLVDAVAICIGSLAVLLMDTLLLSLPKT
jgi:VanZ family protein